MPQLIDPNFARSIVLLCEHAPEGAFGLVVATAVDEVYGLTVQRVGRTGHPPILAGTGFLVAVTASA